MRKNPFMKSILAALIVAVPGLAFAQADMATTLINKAAAIAHTDQDIPADPDAHGGLLSGGHEMESVIDPKAEHAEGVSEAEQKLPSLFFTPDELDSIYQANDGILNTQTDVGQAAAITADTGPRTINLSGILYHGDKDWVVWLNGERVTPKNIPDRVLGIVVKKDRIALRWLDRATNRIINLVLRPHQEYHIDTDSISLGTER